MMRQAFLILGALVILQSCASGGRGTGPNGDGGDASITIPINVTKFGQSCFARETRERICVINRPLPTGSACQCYTPYAPYPIEGIVGQ